MGQGSSHLATQLLDAGGEGMNREDAAFPPGDITRASQKSEYHELLSTFYSKQQAFYCLKLLDSGCTCAASPSLRSWNAGRARQGFRAKAGLLVSAARCWHALNRAVMESGRWQPPGTLAPA